VRHKTSPATARLKPASRHADPLGVLLRRAAKMAKRPAVRRWLAALVAAPGYTETIGRAPR
jgi:hypothetical protein